MEKKKNFLYKLRNDLSNAYFFIQMKIRLCFLQKSYLKMTGQDILEKHCNNIVYVVHKTFIKKYYFVKISQSKLGHIFLIVCKKKIGRLIREEEDALFKTYAKLLVVSWIGTNKKTRFCQRNTFLSLNY